MNPKNPTIAIEEVSDDEDMGFEDEDYLEHGFFFLDKEPTSEEDSNILINNQSYQLCESCCLVYQHV